MKTFDIYFKESESEENKYVSVKRGFSWTGFFFGALWAFLNELYVIGLVLVIIFVGLRYLEPHAGGLIVVPYFLIPIIVGWLGNDFKRSKLLKKGYTFSKTVQAEDAKTAIEAEPIKENNLVSE